MRRIAMNRGVVSVVLVAAVAWVSHAAARPAAGPGSAQPAEQGTTFTAGGVTLWYETVGAGAGTPLVVVNGGPGFDHGYLHCSDAWDRLARNRRVVFYDQRGVGRSSRLKPGDPCGLAEQVVDLEALRVKLGVERMDLLGHSWGGYLVMAYTALHPDRVAHLVIANSAAPKIQDTAFLFKNIYPEVTEREDGLAFGVELGDAAAIQNDLKAYLSMIFFSPEKRDAFLARGSFFDYNQAVNKLVWADLQRFDLNPELRKFRQPTLVITSRYDFNVAPSVSWAIHKAIPGSEFAIFEKSGHLPFYEETDAFVQRVETFLTANVPAAGR